MAIIIIPISIIFIILINFIYNYSNNFRISDEQVLDYLEANYEGEFKDIKLIYSDGSNYVSGGSGCPVMTTPYKNRFINRYSVYSTYYNSEIIVTDEKNIPQGCFAIGGENGSNSWKNSSEFKVEVQNSL